MSSLVDCTKNQDSDYGFIYPDTFFRLFHKHLIQSNNNNWLVNVKMLVNREVKRIVDKKIPAKYFVGKEIHLSLINLELSNTSCIKLIDVIDNLYRIFKKVKRKYVVILENSDHSTKTMRKNISFPELEKKVKYQEWWRFIFIDQGLKERCKTKKENSKVNSDKRKENSKKEIWKNKAILRRKEKEEKRKQNNVYNESTSRTKNINDELMKNIVFHTLELPKMLESLDVSSPISPITSPKFSHSVSSSFSLATNSPSLSSSSSFSSEPSPFTKNLYTLEEAKILLSKE